MNTPNDTRRQPAEREIEDCGIDHPQYFPGRGIALTEWDDVHVGIGSTPREAQEDAIEMAAHTWNVDAIEPDAEEDDTDPADLHAEDCPAATDEDADCDGDCDLQYYAALYLKAA